MKVEQQTYPQPGQLEIGEELGLMDWGQLLHGLHFYDHSVLNE
jgi:hypothetical protein